MADSIPQQHIVPPTTWSTLPQAATVCSLRHYCKPAPSTKLPLSNNLHHDMSITVIQTICLSVMQTLMDPERRATYDALAGFSANSINPFADATLPADQVR